MGKDAISLDDQGLVPAIVQRADTGEVLMLGYVSPEALERTIDGGDVWFYSRSRSELWHKGDSSGNYMHIKSIMVDCDSDTLLLQIDPDGPACHTGNQTCFFRPINSLPEFIHAQKGSGIIEELFAVIQDRKTDLPERSYTADLFRAGVDRVSQKVIEEAGETAIAGVKGDSVGLVEETADLVYHTLVLLAASGVNPEEVWANLRKRRQ